MARTVSRPIRLSSFTDGTLNVSGGTPGFSNLSDVDGSSITVSGGATLSLPLVTGYTGSGTTLEATGTGSTLDLPNLTGYAGSSTTLEATGAGSSLTLPQVTPPSGTTITADNGGSVSLAPGVLALPSAGVSATIVVPQLPQGVTVKLASNGTFTGGTTFNVAQGDTVNLTGGTFTGGMIFNVAQDATISVGGGFSGSQELLVSGTPDRFRCRYRAIRRRD